MAFREIKTFDQPNENLFEPLQHNQEVRAAPSFDLQTRISWVRTNPLALISSRKFIRAIASLVLVYLGIALGGSYFGPVSGKFTGIIATIFYQWQVSTLMVIIGCIVLYDTVFNDQRLP